MQGNRGHAALDFQHLRLYTYDGSGALERVLKDRCTMNSHAPRPRLCPVPCAAAAMASRSGSMQTPRNNGNLRENRGRH